MVPRRVLVLGCGLSGLAMARWCASQGSEVTVADTRAEPPQLPQLRAELPQAQFLSGEFTGALVEGMDQVLRSPACRRPRWRRWPTPRANAASRCAAS